MADPNNEYDDRSGTNIIVLIVAAIVIAIGAFVVWEMKKQTDLQDCYAAGHRDCAPVDTSSSQ